MSQTQPQPQIQQTKPQMSDQDIDNLLNKAESQLDLVKKKEKKAAEEDIHETIHLEAMK
jgi:hypothetical protein